MKPPARAPHTAHSQPYNFRHLPDVAGSRTVLAQEGNREVPHVVPREQVQVAEAQVEHGVQPARAGVHRDGEEGQAHRRHQTRTQAFPGLRERAPRRHTAGHGAAGVSRRHR